MKDHNLFNGSTILITGGTGSFGKAVLERLLKFSFKEIRIFSRDEKKQDDMRNLLRNNKIKFHIGDVRDKRSVDSVMPGVDYVFHAAALKQVPSCEFFPIQAVQTNILGTDNVLESAIENKIKKVVILSTDKAVYPINAMGLTKALMEKIMIARSRDLGSNSLTTMCGTRYGNVMASRGSVIPLFVKQIKEGKPITVTDPEMSRFMMTLEDAVDLVFFAFRNGSNGDIFVQKAPAAKISTLVKALLELYNANNEVITIGARHGEKIYEVLVTREDMAKAKDLGNYYCIPADTRDLNYDIYFTIGKPLNSNLEDYHSENTRQLNVEEMKALLLRIPFIRHDILGEKLENYDDLTTLY